MTRGRLARTFWIGAAVILIAAALVAVVAVLKGEFSDTDGRILLTLGALLYTGGAALAGLALVDRGPVRLLGWLVVAAAPVCLVLIAWAVWSFSFDGGGNETADKLAWSAAIALLAGLLPTTSLLLARRRALEALALGEGAVAALAAALSIIGIWAEPSDDTFVKVVAVVWILAALTYFLVPVLQRFTAAREPTTTRILAELDGVELVASLGPVEGVTAEPPQRGERLVLRRRG